MNVEEHNASVDMECNASSGRRCPKESCEAVVDGVTLVFRLKATPEAAEETEEAEEAESK